MTWRALVGLLCSLMPGTGFAGCGPDPEPCSIDGGTYHVTLPTSSGSSVPAVVFLHGLGGSGEATLNNKRLVEPLLRRGYAVIAPDGQKPDFVGGRLFWNFREITEGRDDAGFLEQVRQDAAERFGVDRNQTLLSGFSNGAFFVNYLACANPSAFPAYAPVSGGFWRPMPEVCKGPIKLLHTHGWRDRTVPLEGRKLRDGEFEQGDIFGGLEVWRNANRCWHHRPDKSFETGIFWRRRWSECVPDSALELVLFPGGHTLPKGWADLAIDWFEAQIGS